MKELFSNVTRSITILCHSSTHSYYLGVAENAFNSIEPKMPQKLVVFEQRDFTISVEINCSSMPLQKGWLL